MAENGISEEVKRFITDHIGSIAQLEILLLVRARRDAALSAEAVARELRIDAEWAANELRSLAERGFLAEQPGSPPAYSFAPESKDLERTIDAVDATYRERRVAVADLIFNKPIEHARAFADAFRFRRK